MQAEVTCDAELVAQHRAYGAQCPNGTAAWQRAQMLEAQLRIVITARPVRTVRATRPGRLATRSRVVGGARTSRGSPDDDPHEPPRPARRCGLEDVVVVAQEGVLS
jgi:hypothetical protein